jgi:aminoglycoside phosphotransferase (APT) family kinase protein
VLGAASAVMKNDRGNGQTGNWTRQTQVAAAKETRRLDPTDKLAAWNQKGAARCKASKDTTQLLESR